MVDVAYRPPFSQFRHQMTGRDGNLYFADSGLLSAANSALALGRPLLLTGEPGCGKTDFGFAAATGLTDGSNGVPRVPLEFYVRSDTTARDLRVIFPVAGLLFVLILGLLLRALLAPAYLVAMVVAGFAATLGASALAFRHGLAFSIPIVLYLFVTAIGTDYNILVTARLREEIRDGRSPRDATALAIAHAGPTVAAAALLLGGTFGALLITGVPFFLQIGFAVTLGIALVAMVVSLLLVPATTALLGRVAWWPGTRHAVLRTVEIEESGQARAGAPPGR